VFNIPDDEIEPLTKIKPKNQFKLTVNISNENEKPVSTQQHEQFKYTLSIIENPK
jgi:hypothetical protein